MKKVRLFLASVLVFSGATVDAPAQGWLKKALDKVDNAVNKVDDAVKGIGGTPGNGSAGQDAPLPAGYREIAGKMQRYDDGRLNFTRYELAPGLKTIVLKEYTTDYQFRDGMLAVKNDETGKWGFLNEQGEKVIDFVWEYGSSGTPAFSGGACAVYKPTGRYSGQWCVIDKSGKEVAFPEKSTVSAFRDGYAVVRASNGQIHKRYYINHKGEHVFPHLDEETYAYDDLRAPRPFKEGLAAYYSYTERRYGFMDTTGKIVVEPRFVQAGDFSEGLAVVLVPGTGTTPYRYGYIDASGKMAIEAKFSEPVLPFHDGYAAVQKTNGTVVFIDKEGNVASPEYKDARRFCNGYAFVNKDNLTMQVVNTKFEVIREIKKDFLDFPSRYGSVGSFNDPFVLLDIGNHVVVEGSFGSRNLFTADGIPFITLSGTYDIDAFSGKLARAGNGIIDFEKSLQTGVLHFVILFTKPEF
jgi:hypothetical protein